MPTRLACYLQERNDNSPGAGELLTFAKRGAGDTYWLFVCVQKASIAGATTTQMGSMSRGELCREDREAPFGMHPRAHGRTQRMV